MIRCIFLIIVGTIVSECIVAQTLGDLCANPYSVTLKDPLASPCDYQEISGLDFTNFSDNTFTPSPSCNYGSDNNDIWVKITIPANADGFKITMDSSVITSVDNDYQNFKVAVYSGGSCASLSYKTCKSSSRARVYNNFFDGFSPGDNLYVRIYTDNSPSGTWDKPFFARFTSISTNNSNDACAKASTLIPGNYCNHLATDKGENDNKAPDKLTSTTAVCDPGSAEFGSFDNNQWYSFTVTPTTPQPVRITISNVNCSAGDKVLQAAIWKANTLSCSTWGNGFDLNSPASASEGDLLACAVGTGVVTISENLPVGTYWYTIDGSAGSFCEYSITEAPVVTVPLELIDFFSVLDSREILLKWTCSGTVSSSYFVVEKSLDGNFFTVEDTIWIVANQKDFIYRTNGFEAVYYRLRWVELSGNSEYSKIIFTGNMESGEENVKAIFMGSNILKLFYKGSEKKSNGTMRLTSASGLEVNRRDDVELNLGENVFSFSGLNFPSGIYFLQIAFDDQFFTVKLILVD